MYIGMIGVGEPTQYFGCVLDTGSADTWVFSAESRDRHQQWIHYYQPTKSQTIKNLPITDSAGQDGGWSITYGKGAASGYVTQDTLWIGGYPLFDTHLALVTSTNNDPTFTHQNEPIDGIFGLGFPQLATQRRMAVMSHAGPSKQPATFAFHMGTTTGDPQSLGEDASQEEIDREDTARHPESFFQLGPRNMSLAPLGFTEVPILDPDSPGIHGRWVIEVDALAVDGSDMSDMCSDGSNGASRCLAWVDSGSSFILLPPRKFWSIMSRLISSRPDCTLLDCASGGRVTCSIATTHYLPTLSIRLNKRDFFLTPEQYVLYDEDVSKSSSSDGETTAFLQLGFGCMDARVQYTNIDVWIIGDTFLKNYYTVFEMRDQLIAIAHRPGLKVTWWMLIVVMATTFFAIASILACINYRYRQTLREASSADDSSRPDASIDSFSSTSPINHSTVSTPPSSISTSSITSAPSSQSSLPPSQPAPSRVHAILRRARGGYDKVGGKAGTGAQTIEEEDEHDHESEQVDIEMADRRHPSTLATSPTSMHQTKALLQQTSGPSTQLRSEEFDEEDLQEL